MRKRLIIFVFMIITILIISTIVCAKTGTLNDTDFLNLRESPSTSANIVTVLPQNASFEILEEQGDWYKIKYQDYLGYVSKQYVKVDENVINTNIPAKANSEGIINKTSKIYVLPLINSTVIGEVNVSDKILVVSIAGKWSYIQTDNISGWIFTDNINGVEDTSITDNISENTDKNEDLNSQDTNENNKEINDNTENANQNSIDEEIAKTDDEENTNNTNYPKTMYVNVDAVYIRSQSTTDSEIVASIGLNTPVTVNGEEGEWYKVKVTDGSGYMMKKYLSDTKQ